MIWEIIVLFFFLVFGLVVSDWFLVDDDAKYYDSECVCVCVRERDRLDDFSFFCLCVVLQVTVSENTTTRRRQRQQKTIGISARYRVCWTG